MQNLSFTSEHNFNEITLFIHHQYTGKKLSLNQIRHNIAEKEGFNSVESYVIALNNIKKTTLFPLYCDRTKILFHSEGNIIEVETLISYEDYSDSCGSEKQIVYSLFGDDVTVNNYVQAMDIDEKTRFISTATFDWKYKNDTISALSNHYKKYNGIQKYLFDEIIKIVKKHVSNYGLSDLSDFIENSPKQKDLSSYHYDFDEGSQSYFNLELSHEEIISGLPSLLYGIHKNQNYLDMSDDESYTTKDIISQSINDTWNTVAEKLVNKYLEYIYNKYLENSYDMHNDVMSCMPYFSNIYNTESDNIIPKLFSEYITA
jgi:hypothetical protein